MKVIVDDNLIKRLERLALIEIKDVEKEDLKKDLNEIIEFFNKIDELDLSKTEPLFHPIESGKLRNNVESPSLNREEALSNVKRKENGYIIGPSTVE
ncbi:MULTISPECIES: Asp-tRNA(Asn) amidotransferase subunit GatC [Acidianus]|uniref:Aspartyl/glutamyl-tRNA(Asn/Gln) amidotransferase subunit C n=1 Tax=Candidatus Acidianus copahuensis TaxID=1160895 RepID=A0A031LNY3_9CREN|nr:MULTISPECIES: Asp-tRNA(Asn) amidotransferase subunit GatC [Acidianus]EZQ06792.1 glutamyl-tRNA amidotransferase [Candidatus Acidianus copahuensis]NON61802.1 Asp-tRNA(Asn) amidotransferase subunit GatC [Acidianus sp. RZ1]